MVKYEHEELYRADSVDKQLKIATDDNQTVITNTEIESEQFELSESLCSESQLHFGACEASSVTFKIHNIFASMKEKWITITETLEGNADTPFQFGRYKVFSDVPTADRRYRNVKAYDAMYDIINADVADWYNEVLPEKDSTITLKDFRTSFINHFGLQQRDIELINDDMVIEKTVNPSQLSGKNVITAICEINACFGHIDREGKFAYIYLPQMIQGLYPANDLYPDHAPDYLPYQQETGHLYPQNPKGTSIGANGTYISCQYEDWIVKGIKKLQIREKENDIGVVYPDKKLQENENSYVIQDNFLVYGKSTEQLKPIAEKIYNQINGIIYRPYDAEVQGNPCLEVGDPIRMSTRYEIIESYILSRTLKGVQGLRDSFSAGGEEYYNEKVNSVQNSIIQLRGKSNTLERTIEETKSTITDVEKGLQTQITQNAESITSEAKRAQTKEEELNGTITKTEETLSSKIEQTAENITSTVSKATSKYDESGLDITLYGYVDEPETAGYKASENRGKLYLNQSNGKVYVSDGNKWNYSQELKLITSQLDSEIQQTASSITSTVSGAMNKYDTTGYEVELYGYEEPSKAGYKASENNGKYYLNQTNGYLYRSNGTSWVYQASLKLITENLSSRIEQTVKSITIEVSEDGKTAGITVTMEDGETKEATGKIDLSGLVTFHDLENAGETTINGSNITTGTITGQTINGGTISGATITGNTISGGTITGTEIYGSTIQGDLVMYLGSLFGMVTVISSGDSLLPQVTFLPNGHNCRFNSATVSFNNIAGSIISGNDIIANSITDYGNLSCNGAVYTSGGMTSYGSIYALATVGYSVPQPDGTTILVPATDTTTETANTRIGGAGKILRNTASAKRFKEDFSKDLTGELNPEKLYDIDVMSYKYKTSYLNNKEDIRYHKDVIGFIADDVMEKYPIAADYYIDENGKKVVEDWNFRYMIPPMLKLIQDQKKEIDSLKESVSFLMEKVNEMEERLK